ncbi:hypothetical protein [Actinomyces minihominis]|uniref:hypothetical protein n=1 Tax=Actinomyces minihominis TaxID=2002838 RepID=UPI000C068264|nr:hypothetical protein [Actinomyces minihominis]
MIPIPAANKIIDGINQINEGLTELSRWVEEQAFDGIEDEYALAGGRPRTPVETAPSEQPAVEAEPEASEPAATLVEVRTALSALSQAGKTEQVRSLIEATGADKLSAVPEDKYAWLMARAKEISDA